MKASDLIIHLATLIQKHGDLPVEQWSESYKVESVQYISEPVNEEYPEGGVFRLY